MGNTVTTGTAAASGRGRPTSRRRAGGAVLGLLLVTAAGCAGGTDASSPDTGSGVRDGTTYTVEPWYRVAPGPSPTQVVVTFDGPEGAAGGDCEADRQAVVTSTANAVTVSVRRYRPPAVSACPESPQTITATLPEPLGDRALVSDTIGWRFRAQGGQLVLDPASTPCGREDCSTPAKVPASCNPADYDATVSEQLGVHDVTATDARCDGSFLVLTKGSRAWFVNRQAGWRLVTTGYESCDSVLRSTRIRFPEPLCR